MPYSSPGIQNRKNAFTSVHEFQITARNFGKATGFFYFYRCDFELIAAILNWRF